MTGAHYDGRAQVCARLCRLFAEEARRIESKIPAQRGRSFPRMCAIGAFRNMFEMRARARKARGQ
jgi:hypothetical protein